MVYPPVNTILYNWSSGDLLNAAFWGGCKQNHQHYPKPGLFSKPRALCLQIDLNSAVLSLPLLQAGGNEDAVVMENPPGQGWTLNVLGKSSPHQMSLSRPCGPSTGDEVCTPGSAGLLLERLLHLHLEGKLNVCAELGHDLANGKGSHICY